MKHFSRFTILFLSVLFTLSCSKDDDTTITEDFFVAFENPSMSFSPEDHSKDIKIVFSRTAIETGTISITYTPENAIYDEDFSTMPEAVSGTIILDVTPGMTETHFSFHKLQTPLEGEEKSIEFFIETISISNAYAQGNTHLVVSLTESAALGGNMFPEVGGPNQPNQVYIDLSAQQQTARNRAQWDFGFSGGNQFRVVLNGSLYMAAAQLNSTNIDQISEADVMELQGMVAVGTFDPANMAYIDQPDGNLSDTAIASISENNDDNKVYLVNMGYSVGTGNPNPGSVAIAGEHRGWKKIRILRQGENYIFQYADLNSTTHQTATITKDGNYNFAFFSLTDNSTIAIEPEKTRWDLNFTVFTNEIEGFGSYGYADFVAANRQGGVTGYLVEATTVSYTDFSAKHVQESQFTNDQRFIGSNWRFGGGPDSLPALNENVFFIIKDPEGNVYKLRFTALLNDNGLRGYPAFEYQLL